MSDNDSDTDDDELQSTLLNIPGETATKAEILTRTKLVGDLLYKNKELEMQAAQSETAKGGKRGKANKGGDGPKGIDTMGYFQHIFLQQMGNQRSSALNALKKKLPELLIQYKMLPAAPTKADYKSLLAHPDKPLTAGAKIVLYPPLIYEKGKRTPGGFFRTKALALCLRFMLFGAVSLEDEGKRKNNNKTVGKKWEIRQVNSSAIAMMCTMCLFVVYWISVDDPPIEEYHAIGAKSKVSWSDIFLRFMWAIEQAVSNGSLGRRILAYWNEVVFAGYDFAAPAKTLEAREVDEADELQQAMAEMDLSEQERDDDWQQVPDDELEYFGNAAGDQEQDFEPPAPPPIPLQSRPKPRPLNQTPADPAQPQPQPVRRLRFAKEVQVAPAAANNDEESELSELDESLEQQVASGSGAKCVVPSRPRVQVILSSDNEPVEVAAPRRQGRSATQSVAGTGKAVASGKKAGSTRKRK
ncbi:hypothetical protein C8F01DRAFT_1377717 [Mycena amicta]|nr:hypothetical protein C8F01DRAFT_1377717 [Mycena amicta]